MHRALGLVHYSGRRCTRGYAHYVIRVGEWEARGLSRNGRETVQSVRWERRDLAHATGAV
jgi:hypothetical protein